MGGARSQRGEPITDINITPLVDVVLVLLIVSMVAAGSIVSSSIPADLPESHTAESERAPFVVVVSPSGALTIGGQPTSDADLGREASSLRRRDPSASVVIAADGRVPHARVVEVIDVLRAAGVTRFGFQVVPAEGPV
jgi:biopolymer transport protein TolR